MKKILFTSLLFSLTLLSNAQSNPKEEKKITGKWRVHGIIIDDKTYDVGYYGLDEILTEYIKKIQPDSEKDPKERAKQLLQPLVYVTLTFNGKGDYIMGMDYLESPGTYTINKGTLTFLKNNVPEYSMEYVFEEDHLILSSTTDPLKLKTIYRKTYF